MRDFLLVAAGVFVGALIVELLNKRQNRKRSIVGNAFQDILTVVRR